MLLIFIILGERELVRIMFDVFEEHILIARRLG